MKLSSAIALLSIAHSAFAESQEAPGRFELLLRDPGIQITSTNPLEGSLSFVTADGLDKAMLRIELFDMKDVSEDITSCSGGASLGEAATPQSEDVTVGSSASLGFTLPDSVWNDGGVAKICACLKTVTDDGNDIDELEFLGTITRTFTGDFSLAVSTKTKDSPFTSVEDTVDTDVNMDAFVCDGSDQPVQDKVFAQGQGMLFIVITFGGSFGFWCEFAFWVSPNSKIIATIVLCFFFRRF